MKAKQTMTFLTMQLAAYSPGNDGASAVAITSNTLATIKFDGGERFLVSSYK